MMLRYFRSRPTREAHHLQRRVKSLLRAQRDLLSPQAVTALQTASAELDSALESGAPPDQLQSKMAALGRAADKSIRPYPNPSARENVDVILVALVVALSIRTFFLQPMAIPTGSMQPTLFGVRTENLKEIAGAEVPGFLMRGFHFWILGRSYFDITARAAGRIETVERPQAVFLPFIRKQRFLLGNVWHTIWFPPKNLPALSGIPEELLLFAHGGARPNQVYEPGDSVIKVKVTSGDRLFADRFTYNFRQPRRGEIIIFTSTGIRGLIQDTHYIKRLVALGGEEVRIGNDRHLIIDGERLDATTARFENIFASTSPPRENQYSGYVNNLVAQKHGRPGIAPLFPDETEAYTVRPNHYLAFGDNTMNSHDSRAWGDFQRERVVGRCGFVFWPISPRFGWGFR